MPAAGDTTVTAAVTIPNEIKPAETETSHLDGTSSAEAPGPAPNPEDLLDVEAWACSKTISSKPNFVYTQIASQSFLKAGPLLLIHCTYSDHSS